MADTIKTEKMSPDYLYTVPMFSGETISGNEKFFYKDTIYGKKDLNANCYIYHHDRYNYALYMGTKGSLSPVSHNPAAGYAPYDPATTSATEQAKEGYKVKTHLASDLPSASYEMYKFLTFDGYKFNCKVNSRTVQETIRVVKPGSYVRIGHLNWLVDAVDYYESVSDQNLLNDECIPGSTRYDGGDGPVNAYYGINGWPSQWDPNDSTKKIKIFTDTNKRVPRSGSSGEITIGWEGDYLYVSYYAYGGLTMGTRKFVKINKSKFEDNTLPKAIFAEVQGAGGGGAGGVWGGEGGGGAAGGYWAGILYEAPSYKTDYPYDEFANWPITYILTPGGFGVGGREEVYNSNGRDGTNSIIRVCTGTYSDEDYNYLKLETMIIAYGGEGGKTASNGGEGGRLRYSDPKKGVADALGGFAAYNHTAIIAYGGEGGDSVDDNAERQRGKKCQIWDMDNGTKIADDTSIYLQNPLSTGTTSKTASSGSRRGNFSGGTNTGNNLGGNGGGSMFTRGGGAVATTNWGGTSVLGAGGAGGDDSSYCGGCGGGGVVIVHINARED